MFRPSQHRHPAQPFSPTALDLDEDLDPDDEQPPADPCLPWRPWSQAWTRQAIILTGRDDVTVLVAPGAGGDAPACSWPDLGRIEVDATHIGEHPTIADPARAGHKKQVPTGFGLLVHEAAHTRHSRWQLPPFTAPVLIAAAELLEESRAELCHRQRRRGDRRWLRHTVTTLLEPADAPIDDPWHAGVVAALLLARADAGTITARDCRSARAAVTGVIGRPRLLALREVWRAAHTTGDTDAATMLDLAHRWCQILGIDPTTHPEVPTPDPAAFAGRLAAAIIGYLAAAAGLTPTQWIDQQIAKHHGAPATWSRREPTTDEHQAARTLAARLAAARTRNPEPARTSALTPPGRLRTRAAIAADAQRAAGAIPTAEPWLRRTTTPPPKPHLNLAILVDTSGSMATFMTPLSSASWIFTHAGRHNHASVTTIAFADTATLVLAPRRWPNQVLEMDAADGTSAFIEAVHLADTLLDLRSRRTLRLLAVVSDGQLDNPEPSQRVITAVHRGGCPVLWLRPEGTGRTFADTRTVTVTNPVDAITVIADAAVTAIEIA